MEKRRKIRREEESCPTTSETVNCKRFTFKDWPKRRPTKTYSQSLNR
jgi:hypothetical protein